MLLISNFSWFSRQDIYAGAYEKGNWSDTPSPATGRFLRLAEIPAILISAAYGLWLGVTFTGRISQRDLAGFGYQVRHAIRMFFFIVFPLFILAALIETLLISSM
jgi:hypothetical protein